MIIKKFFTKQNKDYYSKHGYIILRNFFKKNLISKIDSEILKKIKKKNSNKFLYYEKINNNKVLRRIEKVSDYSKSAKKIVNSKSILIFNKFLTEKKYVLFKDKLNFKFPKAMGYLPHIDGHFYWRDKNGRYQNGWKKYSDDFINVVIPLEKSDKQNGCLYVADKKYSNKIGKSWHEITKSLEKNSPNIKEKDNKKIKYKPMILNKGDILLFNWLCPHYSLKNKSDKSRKIFYATYSLWNKKYKNVRSNYYIDKKQSLNSEKIKSLQFTRTN